MTQSLFTTEDPPRLIGGRDRASGRIVFPHPGSDLFEAVPLGRLGTLWTYTVQRFRPKSPPYAGPVDFTPWVVAYVEITDEVIVEARLVDVDIDAIRIGMAVEFCTVALDPDAPSSMLLPAFRPVTGQSVTGQSVAGQSNAGGAA